MRRYRVADWMSSPAVVVSPTLSLAAAQQVMDRCSVRRLPVVQDGRLVGVLTRGDLSAAQPAESTLSVHEWRALLEKVTVSEVMSREPLSIEAEAMALEAAQLMLARGVSGLPVTVGGKVVGVITESDLFRLLIAELSNAAEADPGRSLLICYHCGAALRRRPPITIGPDDECWRCHYHLHRCENCRYFDGIGCMLGRAERQAPVPGRSCEVFAYLPPRNMGVKR